LPLSPLSGAVAFVKQAEMRSCGSRFFCHSVSFLSFSTLPFFALPLACVKRVRAAAVVGPPMANAPSRNFCRRCAFCAKISALSPLDLLFHPGVVITAVRRSLSRSPRSNLPFSFAMSFRRCHASFMCPVNVAKRRRSSLVAAGSRCSVYGLGSMVMTAGNHSLDSLPSTHRSLSQRDFLSIVVIGRRMRSSIRSVTAVIAPCFCRYWSRIARCSAVPNSRSFPSASSAHISRISGRSASGHCHVSNTSCTCAHHALRA
jgi:hypothetical protein